MFNVSVHRFVCKWTAMVLVLAFALATPAAQRTWAAAPGSLSLQETLSAGYASTCVIRTDGRLQCWGNADALQVSGPNGSTDTFSQVSAGQMHTCALKTNGRLQCWGSDFSSISSAPNTSTDTYRQVVTGNNATCALKASGRLQCWGSDADGASAGPNGSADSFTQLSRSFNNLAQTCGRKANGRLQCWGNDVHGQTAGPNASTDTFAQVSTSGYHACGLKTDGHVQCWGYNSDGQTAGPNASTDTFTQISTGRAHTCALRTSGRLQCWGYNLYTQSGGPNTSTDSFTQVSTRNDHTCGLKANGSLQCWGLNDQGQVSGPNAGGASVTQRQLAAGSNHTCASNEDGSVVCWGGANLPAPPSGAFVQLTGGISHTCGLRPTGDVACWGVSVADSLTPPPSIGFTQISAAAFYTCGVSADGTLACWGSSDAPPSGAFTQVGAGFYHACAIKTDGTLACWGDDSFGAASPPGGTFIRVASGFLYSCAIKTDGTLACWGDTRSGQGSPPPGTFTQLSAGQMHACAIKTDGTLACWGDNRDGQRDAPEGRFTRLTAGDFHSCAVRDDGTVTCWGLNNETQAPRLDLSPDTLPDGSVGRAYSQSFSTSGGTPPYSYSLASGSLPSGLSVGPGGVLSGTPSAGGSYALTVRVRDSFGIPFSTLQAYTLTISGPSISSVSPRRGVIGSGDLTLTVNGGGFVETSVVRWNGQDLATSYRSDTQLSASVPAGLLTSATTAQITVFSPAAGGGISSAQTPFAVFTNACTVAASGGNYPTIQLAVNDPDCQTIDIAPGTYRESISIPRDVTIRGAGTNATFVDGGGTARVFDITGGTVSLSQLTIQNGFAVEDDPNAFPRSGGGGGIRIRPGQTAVLSHLVLTGNAVSLYLGGAMLNDGTALVSNVAVTGNAAGSSSSGGNGSGGGIANRGTMTLENATVSDNFSGGLGGGIYNLGVYGGDLVVKNSTIANNNNSGIVTRSARATLTNVTVTGNDGAGIFSQRGNVKLSSVTLAHNHGFGLFVEDFVSTSSFNDVKNSIIADNSGGTGSNCGATSAAGVPIDRGNNLRWPQSDTSCVGSYGDPKLSDLADNGGPTLTMALQPGSAAIDAGTCSDADSNPVPADQRGVARPQPTGARCDIGAFEREQLQQAQAITFAALANKTYGDPPFTVSATAASGLPVSFAAAGTCTVAATTVTLTGAGTCTVTASQAGNASYLPAPDVPRSFAIAKAPATLSLSDLVQTYDGTPKAATVTTSPLGVSGVTVRYDGAATVPTNPGSYAVVAALTHPNYQAANATGTLVITTPTPSPSGLSPVSSAVDSAQLTLTVSGSGFVPASVVRWNGTDLVTSYVSASQLSAIVPASRLTTIATAEVTVVNPPPGGGSSTPRAFFITQAGTSVRAVDSASGTDPLATVPGAVTAAATGTGTLVVAAYSSNPAGTPGFASGDSYADVYLGVGHSVSQVSITLCGTGSLAYWWNGSSWLLASDQRATAATGCVTVTVTSSTTPSVSDLHGTAFALGSRAPTSFSSLSSPTSVYGAAATTLAGRLSSSTSTPPGTVAITLNGVTQQAAIGGDGRFASSFSTSALPAGVYPISYRYAQSSAFEAATGSGTLTVQPAQTTLLYSGGQIVNVGSSLALATQLSSPVASCMSGQPVRFTLDDNPSTPAAGDGPYALGTATTDGSGGATLTLAGSSTSSWPEGVYTLTAAFAGTASCTPSADEATLTVARPGSAATGGGWYTLSGSGRTNFGFTVRKVDGRCTASCAYTGQLLLVNSGKWRLKGSLTTYATTASGQGAASGSGDLYWWDARLNGGAGAWALAKAGVSYTLSVYDSGKAGKAATDAFGIRIVYTPVAPQPSTLPNAAPQVLKGGDIKVS